MAVAGGQNSFPPTPFLLPAFRHGVKFFEFHFKKIFRNFLENRFLLGCKVIPQSNFPKFFRFFLGRPTRPPIVFSANFRHFLILPKPLFQPWGAGSPPARFWNSVSLFALPKHKKNFCFLKSYGILNLRPTNQRLFLIAVFEINPSLWVGRTEGGYLSLKKN